MRIVQVAAACVLVASCVLVTACAPSVDGAPVADAKTSAATRTVAAGSELWDPCTIPDAAIDAAGLDVSTEEVGIMGRNRNGFMICSWNDQPPEDWYTVSIFHSAEDLDWVRDPTSFDRLESVRVGRRDAIRYQTVGADSSVDCNVAFEIEDGLVMVTLVTSPLVDGAAEPPCMKLDRTVSAIDSHIPM